MVGALYRASGFNLDGEQGLWKGKSNGAFQPCIKASFSRLSSRARVRIQRSAFAIEGSASSADKLTAMPDNQFKHQIKSETLDYEFDSRAYLNPTQYQLQSYPLLQP